SLSFLSWLRFFCWRRLGGKRSFVFRLIKESPWINQALNLSLFHDWFARRVLCDLRLDHLVHISTAEVKRCNARSSFIVLCIHKMSKRRCLNFFKLFLGH